MKHRDVEDGEVTLTRPAFTLETAYGSIEPLSRPEDLDRVAREAKEARVEGLVMEMRGDVSS